MIGNNLWNKLFGLGEIEEEIRELTPVSKSVGELLSVTVRFRKCQYKYASIPTYSIAIHQNKPFRYVPTLLEEVAAIADALPIITRVTWGKFVCSYYSEDVIILQKVEEKIKKITSLLNSKGIKVSIPYESDKGNIEITFKIPL